MILENYFKSIIIPLKRKKERKKDKNLPEKMAKQNAKSK